MPTIPIDVGPQARGLDWFGHEVHMPTKDFGDSTFQRN
jgi:hypothetical protein